MKPPLCVPLESLARQLRDALAQKPANLYYLARLVDEQARLNEKCSVQLQVLQNDLTTALAMLAGWCNAIDATGFAIESWFEHYKQARFSDGPLRSALDDMRATLQAATRPQIDLRRVRVFKLKGVPGKNKLETRYELEPDGEALFHGFGVGFEELNDGNVNYTTAIVERPDGSIVEVPAQHIKFL